MTTEEFYSQDFGQWKTAKEHLALYLDLENTGLLDPYPQKLWDLVILDAWIAYQDFSKDMPKPPIEGLVLQSPKRDGVPIYPPEFTAVAMAFFNGFQLGRIEEWPAK